MDVLQNPELLAKDGSLYWETALYKWMVPDAGMPSPHAIMAGQWQPSDADFAAGYTGEGFGTVMGLIDGENMCGSSKNREAKKFKDAYAHMTEMLGANQVKTATELDNCDKSQKAKLPKTGNFSKMPTYLTPTYDQAGVAMNEGTTTCVATSKPTMFSLYQPDAYRLCSMSNLEPTSGPVDQYAKAAEAT